MLIGGHSNMGTVDCQTIGQILRPNVWHGGNMETTTTNGAVLQSKRPSERVSAKNRVSWAVPANVLLSVGPSVAVLTIL